MSFFHRIRPALNVLLGRDRMVIYNPRRLALAETLVMRKGDRVLGRLKG